MAYEVAAGNEPRIVDFDDDSLKTSEHPLNGLICLQSGYISAQLLRCLLGSRMQMQRLMQLDRQSSVQRSSTSMLYKVLTSHDHILQQRVTASEDFLAYSHHLSIHNNNKTPWENVGICYERAASAYRLTP
jgi:hypothetical protein